MYTHQLQLHAYEYSTTQLNMCIAFSYVFTNGMSGDGWCIAVGCREECAMINCESNIMHAESSKVHTCISQGAGFEILTL